MVPIALLAVTLVIHAPSEEGRWADNKTLFDEARMALMRQAHDEWRRVSQAEIVELAKKQFGDDLLRTPVRGLPADAVEILFNAVETIFLAGGGVDWGVRLKALCNEMKARFKPPFLVSMSQGSASKCSQRTYFSLFNGRMIDLADNFIDSSAPDLSPLSLSIDLPSSVSMDQPSVFFPPIRGQSLPVTVEPVNLQEGISLVGVVHPGCYFSKNAMAFIERNSSWFSRYLPDNTIWVSTQWRSHTYRQLRTWNEQAELVKVSVAYWDNAWPDAFELDTTPIFYLVKDGVVVDRLTGWIGESSAQAFQDMLLSINEEEGTRY